MFGHDICFNGRLDTFLIFSAFKIHNSVSLWVKITRKPNSIGRPSLCFARKQSSNSATGCDVINRWIIGTRNFAKSFPSQPPPPPGLGKRNFLHWFLTADGRTAERTSIWKERTADNKSMPQLNFSVVTVALQPKPLR